MAKPVNLKGACLCVVTGASKGIGRALSLECAKSMGPGSLMLLMARDEKALEETKSMVENSNVEIIIEPVDLTTATADELSALLDNLTDRDKSSFDTKIIIHNVGSIGDVSVSADNLRSLTEWQDYYTLNVFNVALLNTEFLNVFKEHKNNLVIVNISSYCGIKPFAGLGLYCSGKAAREMYFRVLAEENPELNVLNYAPGPVQTDMVQSIMNNAGNPNLKRDFVQMKANNVLLKPEQTAKKFVTVLTEGKYKSGDHVDYYD